MTTIITNKTKKTMNYIHITVTGKDDECENIYATATVYNECNVRQSTNDIDYPIESTKEDIMNVALSNPNPIPSYSVTFYWVGGRPNDR